MASVRRIEAGAAFIRIAADEKEFFKGLDRISSRLKRFGREIANISAGIGALGLAIGVPLLGIASAAKDAETALARFNLIFGDTSRELLQRLDKISSTTGVSLATLVEQSSAFGAIFAEMRDTLGDQAFLRIIEKTNDQILNLSALGGIPIEEAANRIKSAYTSTGEAVDQYGINIRKANINQEALRLGINKTVTQLGEAEKQLLKFSLINRQFKRSNISFINLINTLNGQLTILRETIRQMIVDLGSLLNPALVILFRNLNKVLLVLRPIAKILAPLVPVIAVLAAVLVGLAGALALVAGSLLAVAAGMTAVSFVGTQVPFVGALLAGLTGLTALQKVAFSLGLITRQILGMTAGLAALLPLLAEFGALFLGFLGIAAAVVFAIESINNSLDKMTEDLRKKGGVEGIFGVEKVPFASTFDDIIEDVREAFSFTDLGKEIFRGLPFQTFFRKLGEATGRRLARGGGDFDEPGGGPSSIIAAAGFIKGPIAQQAAFGGAGGGTTEAVNNLAAIWLAIIDDGKAAVRTAGANTAS